MQEIQQKEVKRKGSLKISNVDIDSLLKETYRRDQFDKEFGIKEDDVSGED